MGLFKYDYGMGNRMRQDSRLQRKFEGYMDEDGYFVEDSERTQKFIKKMHRRKRFSHYYALISLVALAAFSFVSGMVFPGIVFLALLGMLLWASYRKGEIKLTEHDGEPEYLEMDEVPYEERQTFNNRRLLDNIMKDPEKEGDKDDELRYVSFTYDDPEDGEEDRYHLSE